MRKTFKMTEEQYQKLLDAGRPTAVMYLSGGVPMARSPQENANDAWKQLAKELGFIWDTVKPIPGNNVDDHLFTAEATP